MKMRSWGILAFVASLYLVAAYAGDLPVVVQFLAILVSAGGLILRQRTGPFPFLTILVTSHIFMRMAHPMRFSTDPVGFADLLHLTVAGFYILATNEHSTLRLGYDEERKRALPLSPSVLSPAVLSFVVAFGAWLSLQFVAQLGPYPDGLELSAILLWLLIGGAVLALLGFRFRELVRGDRDQAYQHLLETVWRPHRKIWRLLFRLRGKS